MSGFQDALSNIMPIDWLDPYGRTPFANDAEMSVDITIVETDDGIRASSVKNPPKSGSNRLMNAIKNALGVGFVDCMDPCSSSQAADLGKQKDNDNNEKKAGDTDDRSSASSKQGLREKKPGGFGQGTDAGGDTKDDETSGDDKDGLVRKK